MELLIDKLYKELSKEISEEVLEEKKKQIKTNIEKLKTIKNFLVQQKVLKQSTIGKSSSLSKFLNQYKRGIKLDLNEQINDTEWLLIAQKIGEAYEITSTLLSDLNFHNPVSMTLYYQDKEYGIQRIENFKLTPEMISYEFRGKTSQKNQYMRLKLNETIVRQEIHKLAQTRQKYQQNISNHYEAFKKLLVPKRGSKWQPNQGIVAEAFERHWEKIHAQTEEFINDILTRKEVWALYILSSDNAPYYSGADTDNAQVKALNASLISNVNTVLNTMESLILLFEQEVSSQEVPVLLDSYYKAFSAREDKTTISKKLQDAMGKGLTKEVQKYFVTEK